MLHQTLFKNVLLALLHRFEEDFAVSVSSLRWAAMASLLILAAPLARSQVTLTGAAWIATTSDGSSSVEMAYADGFDNTVGGDQ
jgi:hypothetical protein